MTDSLRNRLRRLAGLLPALALLASCGLSPTDPVRSGEPVSGCVNASLSNPLGGGMGGTGAPRVSGIDPGGIGGTGQMALRPGLGGTGQVAAEGGLGGTGIVGVVTGFASICVNGLEVDYAPDTAVWQDGVSTNTGVLAVGQLVALQAIQSREGLNAQRIDVLDAVVGPISAINRETGHIALVGQIAQAQEPSDLVGLAVGDWARVSGLTRASGEIRATRVQRATPGSALLRGKVSQLAGNTFMIGATPINGIRLRWLADLAEGQEVLLHGRWSGVVFEADAGTREPTKTLIQRSQEVVLEGYIQRVRGLEVDMDYAQLTMGSDVQVVGGEIADLRVGQKVQIHGRMGAGSRVTIARLEYLRESRRGDGARARPEAAAVKDDDTNDDSRASGGSSDDSGRGRGRGGREGSGSSGSGSSGSGSSGSGSSGSGSSGSGSSGSGSSGSGSSGSGSSGSGSSGSGSSGSGSSGSGSSGSGSSGSGSSGSGSSGSGSSGSDSGSRGRGRGRGVSDRN